MQLDERSRERLRALAEADGGAEIDEQARGRIARRVASDGPRVVRRAHRVRTGVQALGGCAALGLCALAVWIHQDSRSASNEPRASLRAPQVAQKPFVAAPVAPRACERRGPIAVNPSAAGDGQRFDLGELGTLVAARDTVVAIDAADPCRVRVRLERGSVAVHAAELGGGELRVVSPSAEVSVHGTMFSVTEREGVLTVDVDEGRVAVAQPGRAAPWTLVAGVRLRVARGESGATEPLAAADRVALQRTLGLLPDSAPAKRRHDPGPAASAEALVAEADGLWRAGELDSARERYRRAGALGGVTAEAAWLALARRELSLSRAADARAALASYRRRFPRGKLAAEGLGIEFRAAVQQVDHVAAQRIARELQRRHPGTPQAEAAARWQQERAQGGR
jgi:ferric-dicitrate binding protein FerR (iron transport regulator)